LNESKKKKKKKKYQLSGLKSGGENKLVETRTSHSLRVIGVTEEKKKKEDDSEHYLKTL